MPNHEKHCDHTETLYGVRTEDIHKWMDGPSVIFGPGHRSVRHDVRKIRTDPEYIPLKFREKYGLQLTKSIMLDHSILDKKSVRRKKGKGRILVSEQGVAYISQVILSNLQLSDTGNIEIPYIVCPDIVLLYNPNRVDRMIDNLKLLLAKLLLKQGNLDEVRQMLSEGLVSDTTGKVAPQVYPLLLPSDASPVKVN